MQLKKISLGLFIVIIGATAGWKLWQKSATSGEQIIAQVEGPAVILFKGDYSADCRAIYKIVNDARLKHSGTINFIDTDWSEDNPLINKYQIRFLPTVVFVDQNNTEVERIVGEGEAIEQKLEQRLSQVENLSEH
jgi:thioredoxin-like negative regulator of GroEL